MAQKIFVAESPLSKFIFADSRVAWFWLIVRLYVGWEWVSAGWEKVTSPAWFGAQSGTALQGFLKGSLTQASGAHPNVQGWYADFLRFAVAAHPVIWAHVISIGELAVGVALIIGVFTGIAAFFGLFMNLNYLLAGTVSTNPILFTLGIGLVLAWRIAGWWGVDRWLLPRLGTPWQKVEVV